MRKYISVLSTISTFTGLMTPQSPPIRKILKILDHTIFPIAISVCHLFAAIIDVTSSGTEVHIATILAPIMIFETPNISANKLAYLTIRSPHTYNAYIPKTIKKSDLPRCSCDEESSSMICISLFFTNQMIYHIKIKNPTKRTIPSVNPSP